MSPARAPRPRKQHPDRTPDDVTLDVVTAPTYQGGVGVIRLSSKWYYVRCLGSDSRQGYRLVELQSERVYDVDTADGKGVCDCPDCEARHRVCKHIAALLLMRTQGHI